MVRDTSLNLSDPEVQAVLSRKQSAAITTEEPSGLVAYVRQAYHVRKAKFNGANEDVDQYAEEITRSVPVLGRRERDRVEEWLRNVIVAHDSPCSHLSDPTDGTDPPRIIAAAPSPRQEQLTTPAEELTHPLAPEATGPQLPTRSPSVEQQSLPGGGATHDLFNASASDECPPTPTYEALRNSFSNVH